MLVKLYKLVYDISIFYTIGALLLKCFGGISLDVRLFFAVILSFCMILMIEKKRRLKIIATIILPTASVIILMPAIPDIAVFLLAWVYYFYVSITKRGLNSRGEFMDILKYTGIFLILLLLLMLAVHPGISEGLQAACPYFILSLVSTVFLLRCLRIDPQASQWKSYHRYQLIELLSFLIVSFLLALIKAPQNILAGLRLVYLCLISPVLTFIAWVLSSLLSGAIYLIIALYHLITNNKEPIEVKSNPGSSIKIQASDITNTVAPDYHWVLNLIYTTGAVILIIIVFFFLRRLMGRKWKQISPMGISETREDISEHREKRAALIKRRPNDPRKAVRYYYQKDIYWLQHKKVKLNPQDTTEDINHQNLTVLKEKVQERGDSSTELMQLYRKARYRMKQPISGEEAEKAKKLYQTITKGGTN